MPCTEYKKILSFVNIKFYYYEEENKWTYYTYLKKNGGEGKKNKTTKHEFMNYKINLKNNIIIQ